MGGVKGSAMQRRRTLPRASRSPHAVGYAALILVLVAAAQGWSQQRPYHYFYSADMPPGAVGAAQLMRGGPLPGYFQPVEISTPQDTQVALAMDGLFDTPQPGPLRAGLLVGKVYRLRVTNIPYRPGQEVYPSIEIINRLYPPQGSEAKFPIPIDLTQEELELAVRGHFVVRVIYLENPRGALPVRQTPREQRYFEVRANEDPLEVADTLGRPMAILRIGSRIPDQDLSSGRFLFDSPPWTQLPAWPEPVTEEGLEPTPEEPAPAPAAAHGESILKDVAAPSETTAPIAPEATAPAREKSNPQPADAGGATP